MSVQQGTQVAISLDQACDFTSDTYIWTDGDGSPTGAGGTGLPIDLTHYTAKQEFRTTQYGSGGQIGTVLLTLTNGNGITLGGVTGAFIFTLTALQTKALTAGPGIFTDILLTDTISGLTYKAIYSQVFIVPTVSQ